MTKKQGMSFVCCNQSFSDQILGGQNQSLATKRTLKKKKKKQPVNFVGNVQCILILG